MAGAVIEFDLEDDLLEDHLDGLREAAANTAPLMAEIGEIVHEGVMQSFEREQSPEGVPWKPSQRVLLHGGKTLQLNAILVNSIHPEHSEHEARVGTNIVYAAVHQFGWEERRIPARPYLGISDDTAEEIQDAVLAFLRRH